MLEQWMFLNKKSNIEQEKYNNDASRRNDEKTRVYICTTMYREVIFVYSMLDRKVNYLIELLCRVLSSMPFKYVLNLFVLKCR